MTYRAPRITADTVIRVLKKLGFVKVSQKGSHQKWVNPKTGKKTIVPYHKGDIIHPKTLQTIVEGTGLNMGEFRKYL